MRRLYQKRKFLNKDPQTHARIITTVEHPEFSDSEKYKNWIALEAYFSISDCTRTISLDFDVYSSTDAYKAKFKKVKDKLRTLIEEIQNFEKAIIKAEEIVDKKVNEANKIKGSDKTRRKKSRDK